MGIERLRIDSLLDPQAMQPEPPDPEVSDLSPFNPHLKATIFNVALLLALAVALWAPRLKAPIDLRQDAAVYYVLGTSIAEGKGYRLLNEPGDPEAVQHGPLLPALVAAHQKLAGTSDPAVVGQWLRYSFFGLFLLYVLASYVLARQFVKPGLSLMVGLICCLFHYGLFLSDLLVPEMPFALATALLVIMSKRARKAEVEGGQTKAGRVANFLGAAACAVSAFLLILPAGLAVLAAWVGESVFKGRFGQAALRAAVAVAPVLAWQAHVSGVTSSEQYQQPAYAYQRSASHYYNVTALEQARLVDPFAADLRHATRRELGDRALRNVREVPPALGQAVTAEEELWKWPVAKVQARLPRVPVLLEVVVIPITLIGMLAVCGAFVLMTRLDWFTPLYLAGSVALVCLTPWPNAFVRQLAPLTPFLAVCLAVFLDAFRARTVGRGERSDTAEWAEVWWFLGRMAVRAAACTLVAIVAFATGLTYWNQIQRARALGGKDAYYRLSYDDARWDAFDNAVAWLDGQLRSESTSSDPSGVIATAAPHRTYLNTAGLRKAILPPMERDPARSQELLDNAAVKYLIVDELGFLDITTRYARPTVEKHPDLWERVYTVPGTDTHVYLRAGRGGGGV